MKHSHRIVAICLMLLAFPQLVLASKIHIVRKSESLHSIARKYHVSLDELKSVNSLTGTHVDRGVRLIIPSHVDAQTRKAKMAAKAPTYKVAKGDTLPKIARKTGVKMSELRRINGLKGNRIKPGQVLALHESSPAVEEPVRTTATASRLELVNRDLLNEQEFSDSLAELSDIDADRPVDLAKSLEDGNGTVTGAGKLKKAAYSFLGARYRFGGNSRRSLDCSSFVQQVFREQKITLPRTAREQFSVGTEVMRGDLQRGDLVFFQTYAPYASHVGIYLGNRKMIHASSRDRRVVISSMDTPYYLSRYLGARRVGRNVPDGINFNELLQGVEEERESDVVTNDTLGVSLNVNN
ncbi:MAG TPA: NlpC/P60 family protein [Geobacteraceae bacterium]